MPMVVEDWSGEMSSSFFQSTTTDAPTVFPTFIVMFNSSSSSNSDHPKQQQQQGEYNDGDEHGLLFTIIKTIILAIIIFFVVFGNLLVIVAVAKTRRLRRNLTSYFVVSLAVADLLLGIIVLPFMMITITFAGNKWLFGPTLCNLVTCFDITLCTASILNLFLTTGERFIVISWPYRYQRIVKKSTVIASITAIWLISAFCSFVPLHLGWNTIDGAVQNQRPTDDPFVCNFEYNKIYNTTLGITTFFIPFVLLALANVQILHIAQHQRATITYNRNRFSTDERPYLKQNRKHKKQQQKQQQTDGKPPIVVEVELDSANNNSTKLLPKNGDVGNGTTTTTNKTTKGNGVYQVEQNGFTSAIKQFTAENKATLTILTIVGCFIGCWLPYFVYVILLFFFFNFFCILFKECSL